MNFGVFYDCQGARTEGALALQGLWHLSSLAPPPPRRSSPTCASSS
jgi:hypothetical protein